MSHRDQIACGPVVGNIDIRSASYDSPTAAPLVQAQIADLVDRYGTRLEGGVQNETAYFMPPDGTFLVAYLNGQPIGCGGWISYGTAGDTAEIKKMYVGPAGRRRGVGRRILAAVEQSAREYGRRRAILEAGTSQPEALALYEKAGYHRIENYGYFRDWPECRCYAREL